MYVIPIFTPYTLTFYVLHVSYMQKEKKFYLPMSRKKFHH